MLAYFPKLVLFLLVLIIANNPFFAQAPLDEEEYAVYSALLKELHKKSPESNLTICRRTTDDTLGEHDIHTLITKTSVLDSLILRDFNERNKTGVEIENKFDVGSIVTLVEEKEVMELTLYGLSVKELVEEKGWKAFRARYGSSRFLYLSRVGFNPKRTRALLQFGYQSGWLGGEGNYYILDRRGAGWKVRKKIWSWIS